jgi:hypothetical protein
MRSEIKFGWLLAGVVVFALGTVFAIVLFTHATCPNGTVTGGICVFGVNKVTHPGAAWAVLAVTYPIAGVCAWASRVFDRRTLVVSGQHHPENSQQGSWT